MRHALGVGVLLLLLSAADAFAAGNVGCTASHWARTGNMTTPRASHAAVLLPSGKVLVAGGVEPETPATSPFVLATAELYDPLTGTWSATGSMSVGRADHTLTLLPTGKVLVAGGSNFEGRDTRPSELYDPDTGQWTTTGAMLDEIRGRASHTAMLLPTGKVLVVGGLGPDPLATAELYDPVTGKWQPTAPLSNARFLHTATLLASRQVLALGGVLRTGPRATRLRSDAVLVAGGSNGRLPGPGMEAELYEPAVGTWHVTGALPSIHTSHTATLLPSGRVLVVGGGGPTGTNPFTEVFDPESETWSNAGCTLDPRAYHTATLLLSGAVLIAGGTGGSSAELYGLVVSPAQVSLAPGASQTFTARGGSDLGYVWSFVHNASGGTLTASGDYRAGPVGGVTDVVQVVDSFANSATATVDVIRQATTVSATGPLAKSVGCATTRGATLPWLSAAVLLLLGWRSLRVRRRPTL